MTYLSLFDKLKILFNVVVELKFVLVFIILMIVLTLIYIFKKINNKKYLLSMTLLLTLLFAISIIINHKILFNTFDNFTTIFFRNIYFPSIYVYIALLNFITIVFITSLLSKKTKKSYKIANSIMFVLNSIIFAIILNLIAQKKIDVFEISSLYTSTELVAILELDINLVLIWIFAIVIIYITNTICNRIKNKKEVRVPVPIITPSIEQMTSEIKEPKIKNNNDYKPSLAINENVNKTKNNTIDASSKIDSNFNNIINGNIKATYYEIENNIPPTSLKVADPQEIYENKYNSLLSKTEDKSKDKSIKESNQKDGLDLSIETSNENITTSISEKNNISIKEEYINDDILDENNNGVFQKEEPILDITDDKKEENTIIGNYSVEEYKKMVKMLKELKNYTRHSDISIDDAIAISLISNYSFDDCRKFKELLESNLN